MRLFIAIPIPKQIISELADLKTSIQGARWSKTSNYHLTLQFLGELSQDHFHQVLEGLEDINMTSFSLRLNSVGLFGAADNPKVLYTAVEENQDLLDLQSLVKEQVEQIITLEKRKYIPHVTLARLKLASPQDIAHFKQQNHSFKSNLFKVTRFALYSSKLTAEGAIYTMEKEYELY